MTARRVVEARTCEACGKPFGRRTFPSGRLEDATRFGQRRFCSRKCYRASSADGFRVRAPGAWAVAPPQLKSPTAVLSHLDSAWGPTQRSAARLRAAVARTAVPGASMAVAPPRIPAARSGETP